VLHAVPAWTLCAAATIAYLRKFRDRPHALRRRRLWAFLAGMGDPRGGARAPARRSIRGEAVHGIGALNDQQVAGLLMWIPASVGYLGVTAWLLFDWLAREEGDPVDPRGASSWIRPPSA
jgi:hypothetical protein